MYFDATIGPIEHASTFCRIAASDGIGCRCWCLACEQHNAVDHATLTREGAAPAVTETADLCEFVPPHEPFYCRVHHDIRLTLADDRCRSNDDKQRRRLVPAVTETLDIGPICRGNTPDGPCDDEECQGHPAPAVTETADLLDKVAAAVEGMPEWHCLIAGAHSGECGGVGRDAVLAAIEDIRKEASE